MVTSGMNIDLVLAVRRDMWTAVPDTVAGIAAWEGDDRFFFWVELPAHDEVGEWLARQAERGALSAVQRATLASVERLVAPRRAALVSFMTTAMSKTPAPLTS